MRTSDLARVATLELAPGESQIGSGAIDTVHGFAYVGTYTAPGSVIKIRLSDFTRVGSLMLADGENYLRTAVLDPSGDFAYFGTEPVFGPIDVVKVRLSDFSRVGALRLPAPAQFGGTTATMDARGISAYVTNSDTVFRLRLADFTASGSWRPASSGGPFTCSVLDPTGTFGYFGTASSLSTLYKVRLSDLTEQGELYDVASHGWYTASVDPGGLFAYLGAFGAITRIRLSDFKSLGTTILSSAPGQPTAAVVDTALGYLVMETWGSKSQIVRITVPGFVESGALGLRIGENRVSSVVIDSSAGFAYFGTYTSPGLIVKVRLSDFKRVATLTLPPGEDGLTSAVIDVAGGFAYFGTYTDPGIVIKIRLSDFTRVSATTLGPLESYLYSAFLDSPAGFAYFGTETSRLPAGSSGLLVKVRVSDLARIGSRDVTGGPGSVNSAAPAPEGGFAYLGVESAGALGIARVRLSDFTLDGILSLPDLYSFLSAIVLDPISGFAYAVSSDMPSRVARIRLADFTSTGGLNLPDAARWVSTGVIDPAGGWAYFASYGDVYHPERVFRVRLSDFTNAGSLSLDDQHYYSAGVNVGAIDPSTLLGYFATDERPSRVFKVDLGRPGVATAAVSGGGEVCPGGGGTIYAYLSGVPPWSVTWSDGAQYAGLTVSPQTRTVTVSAPTIYSVTSVSDANGPGLASGVATFSIFPPTPPPTITGPLSAFSGASGLTASVPVHAASSYLWYGDSDAVITSGSSSSQIMFKAATNGPTILHASEFGPCQSAWADLVIPVQVATPPLSLQPLTPCRIFDTRNATGPAAASPALAAAADRILSVTSRCGIPATASAISVNAAVTQPAAAGNLSFHAGNEPTNGSLALNFSPGQTRASNAIVRLASDGSGTIGV
ncbi:MAG TPA: hypothetical protein PLB01_12830, partial [Thermoanaerobaculia bacterium]|nr:hypothetical protein [Thermoanaerobaculia bacterium]